MFKNEQRKPLQQGNTAENCIQLNDIDMENVFSEMKHLLFFHAQLRVSLLMLHQVHASLVFQADTV